MMRTLNLCLAVLIATGAGGAAAEPRQSLASTSDPAPAPGGPVLTRGPLTDLTLVTVTSDFRFVGREVAFSSARVERVGPRGFWVSSPTARDQVFVVPAEGSLVPVTEGDLVNLHGEVRPVSSRLRRTLHLPYAWDEHVYIYAYTVRPTGIIRQAAR